MSKNYIDLNAFALQSLGKEQGENLIQLINPEEDPKINESDIPNEIPLLAVKNTVLFPGVVLPITVGRDRSIKLIKEANANSRIIGVVAQKNDTEVPSEKDLHKTGTIARIIKLLVLPDGNTTAIIQGQSRFKLKAVTQEKPFLKGKISIIKDTFPPKSNKELKALLESLKDASDNIMTLSPEIPSEAMETVHKIKLPSFLIHYLASNLAVDVASKQHLLEINDGMERATLLLEMMLKEIQMLELKFEIHNKVHTDIDQQQRDYFLRQQLKVLQDELGDDTPDKLLEQYRIEAKLKKWPEKVKTHFLKELDKIARMNPQAAEYPVHMNYVEYMIELPWEKYSEDQFDLKETEKILNKEHFGLENVKKRILEYLAVLKLNKDLKGPILCLYGPPGVGKTSLGKSIAEAMGREYVRISLGGVQDEAEIRGHRKTYIGAMPGKVIQNIKRAKTSNPVFVLDEIDKLNSDFRGDPSSALLEVLDPEQNKSFIDNYMEVEYDLSKVLFIATSNNLNTIQPALRDRMEIIELTGYTQEEKTQIALKHLIPKQVKEHGLSRSEISITKEAVIKIVKHYTRESGVRSLERKIAALVRYVAKSIAMEEAYKKSIGQKEVIKILGPEVFDQELYSDNEDAGIVTGLAWTSVGGEILFIETSVSQGKGKLVLSGKLGDVMKESAVTALSHLKSIAPQLGIDYRVFDLYDLHIHVPQGAVPKDGPSAGITILTALASIFTQRKVRSKLAMTGEITLKGKVLPVGGIKEKILAAKRAGIKEIILSQKNKKDIEEIENQYIKGLKIIYVDRSSEVLDYALLKLKVKDPLIFDVTRKQ